MKKKRKPSQKRGRKVVEVAATWDIVDRYPYKL
jgi:hypothetical protein